MLFVGNKFVAESWFIMFEEGRTAKDSEVCNAGLVLEAVLKGRCWISILVNNVLARADIDDVNCIGMGMMKLSPSDVHLEMNLVEVKADPASMRMKRTDWVPSRSYVSVSHCLRAVMIEVVLSVGRPIQPVSLPGVVTMNR